MERMVNNSNNNRENMVSRCPPTVTWETVLASRIGMWVINNGETTVVIIKKTVGIYTSSNTTNTNHPNGVAGIVETSVAEVAVAGVGD